jgi:hypothetical protein
MPNSGDLFFLTMVLIFTVVTLPTFEVRLRTFQGLHLSQAVFIGM